ncbi:hypothetical protein [Candidatus Liberibacter africanus]|uniref:hypothetical protein n=1 Tax=Liberibacter africanus TaxID=34020 RepID=UPI001FD1EFD8|nr:hypothetical protein [Candidatus Liberibacter africanus]
MKFSPDLPWVIEAVVQHFALEQEWSEAISFLDKKHKKINIIKYNRIKETLLIARSLENAKKGNILDSYNDAIESLKLRDNSIMGSICAAKALIAQNKKRKAEVILEKIWKTNPHPEIASIYTRLLSKDSTERLRKALQLEEINKKSVESLIIVSKTALEAGNIDQARTKAILAMQTNPRKEIFLLLAQIEKESSNNLNKILSWTQKAIHSIPDPIWISDDGSLSSIWLPLSPISKEICYFEWKVPTKSPEYISYKNIFSSTEDDHHIVKSQFFLENGKKNCLLTAENDSSCEENNEIIVNPYIRQLDDPGVKNKPTQSVFY